MAIHTNLYLLVFLPLVMLIYQLVPRNKRWGVLLSASYVLYFSFSRFLVLLLRCRACCLKQRLVRTSLQVRSHISLKHFVGKNAV